MVDFTRSAATAKRLVEKNGRDSTLYRKNRTPSDPSKPWRGSGSAAPVTMGPVKVAYVPPGGAGFGQLLQDVDGTLRRAADQVGLLAADSIAALSPAPAELDPGKYDSIADGSGQAFRILAVETLKPADTPVLYALILKATG